MIRILKSVRRYKPLVGEPAAGAATQNATAGVAIVTLSSPNSTVSGAISVSTGVAIVTLSSPASTRTPGAVTTTAGVAVVTLSSPASTAAGSGTQTATAGVAIVYLYAPRPTNRVGGAGHRLSCCPTTDMSFNSQTAGRATLTGGSCVVANCCPTGDYDYVSD